MILIKEELFDIVENESPENPNADHIKRDNKA